jgi:hypothetical protein
MNSSALQFMRTLFPEGVSPNYFLLWTVSADVKRSHWFSSIEAAATFADGTNADATYFGLALSPKDFGPHHRCRSQEAAALCGLPFDFDIFGPVHNKPGLPRTTEDALRILRILPERFQPSLIWETGFGIQGLFLFKQSWELQTDGEREIAKALSIRWHRLLADNAKALGYTIDSVYDLSRVLRLPGSLNKKIAGDHRLVRVIEASGRRYNPSDLEEICDLYGIPEIEVRKTDERGRVVEFGDLLVRPRVELTGELTETIESLLEVDGEFAAVWRREKRMPRDSSWSAFAMSIANRLALAGFPDQTIIDLLVHHRQAFGDPGKRTPKPLSWFVLTITKARAWAKEQTERERKRQEREAKAKEAEEREAEERVLIAEVCTGEPEARKVLHDLLELDVRRLVQIGNDVEPGYRLELTDGRVVTIPSLAAMTSFTAFNRYIWRYLRTALPGRAKKDWRTASIALAKLVVVEDIGLGKVELMLTDLGEYFAQAHDALFEHYPADENPDGPPLSAAGRHLGWKGYLVRATCEQEYVVALKLVALPQRNPLSVSGAYYLLDSGDNGAERGNVIFKGPPLFDWLRKKERKFDIDEMNRRLVDAGFQFRDTAMECGIRLRRVWRGTLVDATVDDHQAIPMDECWHDRLRTRLEKMAAK